MALTQKAYGVLQNGTTTCTVTMSATTVSGDLYVAVAFSSQPLTPHPGWELIYSSSGGATYPYRYIVFNKSVAAATLTPFNQAVGGAKAIAIQGWSGFDTLNPIPVFAINDVASGPSPVTYTAGSCTPSGSGFASMLATFAGNGNATPTTPSGFTLDTSTNNAGTTREIALFHQLNLTSGTAYAPSTTGTVSANGSTSTWQILIAPSGTFTSGTNYNTKTSSVAATLQASGSLTSSVVSILQAPGNFTSSVASTLQAPGTTSFSIGATLQRSGIVSSSVRSILQAPGTLSSGIGATLQRSSTNSYSVGATLQARATQTASVFTTLQAPGHLNASVQATLQAPGHVSVPVQATLQAKSLASSPVGATLQKTQSLGFITDATLQAAGNISASVGATLRRSSILGYSVGATLHSAQQSLYTTGIGATLEAPGVVVSSVGATLGHPGLYTVPVYASLTKIWTQAYTYSQTDSATVAKTVTKPLGITGTETISFERVISKPLSLGHQSGLELTKTVLRAASVYNHSAELSFTAGDEHQVAFSLSHSPVIQLSKTVIQPHAYMGGYSLMLVRNTSLNFSHTASPQLGMAVLLAQAGFTPPVLISGSPGHRTSTLYTATLPGNVIAQMAKQIAIAMPMGQGGIVPASIDLYLSINQNWTIPFTINQGNLQELSTLYKTYQVKELTQTWTVNVSIRDWDYRLEFSAQLLSDIFLEITSWLSEQQNSSASGLLTLHLDTIMDQSDSGMNLGSPIQD